VKPETDYSDIKSIIEKSIDAQVEGLLEKWEKGDRVKNPIFGQTEVVEIKKGMEENDSE